MTDPSCTRHPARADGRDVVLPVAAGDGGQPRRLRRARPGRQSATAAAGRRPAGVEGPDGERFEVETTDGVYRCRVLVLAVGVAEPYTPPGPGDGARHPLRRRPAGRDVRRSAGADHRQAELRLRARHRAAAVGAPARPRLAVEGSSCRSTRKTLVGVRARYVQPYEDYVLGGGVSVLDAAIDRIERAADGRLTVHLRRTDGGADLAARGRRRDLRDRVRGAAASTCPSSASRPFGAEPAARPDAVVGERDRARHLLRRDDRPGRQGPPEARRAGELGRRPRRPLQRPRAGRATSRRRTSGSNRSGPTSRPTRSPGFIGDRAGRGARALPPARLPRPGADRRPGRRDARRRRPAAGARPRRRAGRTRSRRRSRATDPGRSTRSSTRASAARSSSTPSSPIR